MGLTAVVHVRMADLRYDSPTTAELASPEAVEAVRVVVAASLRPFLDARPGLRASLGARWPGT